MRHIEHLVNEQIRKWEKKHGAWAPSPESDASRPLSQPVITLAPQFGCGSRMVTEKLHRLTGYEIYGYKMIDKVAESMNIRRKLVDLMDQRQRSNIRNLIDGMITGRHVDNAEYFSQLMQVINVFVQEGSCILLGRGSPFLVNEGQGIRVRIVAPEEQRIVNLMRFYSIGAREAEDRMQKSDQERAAFCWHYFQRDIDDPNQYDLVLNMDRINTDDAVSLILRAMDEMRWKDRESFAPAPLTEEDAEELIKRQVAKWDYEANTHPAALEELEGASLARHMPVLAIQSRFCSGSRLLANELSDRWNYEVFGFRLIDKVAEDMNLSPRIVDRLDQRSKSAIQSLIDGMLDKKRVSRESFFRSLVQVVRALILQGGVILLGRGSAFLVEEGEGLRLHLTAPLHKRLDNMKGFYNIEGRQAEEQLEKSDREREENIKQYHNKNVSDLTNYDLAINMERFTPAGAANVVQRAMEPLLVS